MLRSDSAAAYSNAELGEKQLGFGGMLVFCNGASISLLDESICYQAIESQPFIPTETFSLFPAPPGDDITEDRQLFVGDGDRFCHLIAPYELPTVRLGSTLGFLPAQEVLRITPQSSPNGLRRRDRACCAKKRRNRPQLTQDSFERR